MKTLYSILSAALVCGTTIPAAKADLQVSVDFFHDNLSDYGDWREVGGYGYVWQPRDRDEDWRPYSDGRWVFTDAGWTWDSDEPYSWAVYHYGRWARLDRVGWVWVPGTEWGPAWVSWRESDRHIGWAPLPPEAMFNRSRGFAGGVDLDFDIGPGSYRFVLLRDFGEERLGRHFVDSRENVTYINQTTNITRITYVNNVVYNAGPGYDSISRASSKPIRRLRLERQNEIQRDQAGAVRADQLRAGIVGDTFRVAAPAIDSTPPKAPRKFAAKVEKAQVDRGWSGAGPAGDVEKVRAKMKAERPHAAEPGQPKNEEPVNPPSGVPKEPKESKGQPKKNELDKTDHPGREPAQPQKPAAQDRPDRPERPAQQPDRPGKGKNKAPVPEPAEVAPKVSQPERAPKERKAEQAEKPAQGRREPVESGKKRQEPEVNPAAEGNPGRRGAERPQAGPEEAGSGQPKSEQPQTAPKKGKGKKADGDKTEEKAD